MCLPTRPLRHLFENQLPQQFQKRRRASPVGLFCTGWRLNGDLWRPCIFAALALLMMARISSSHLVGIVFPLGRSRRVPTQDTQESSLATATAQRLFAPHHCGLDGACLSRALLGRGAETARRVAPPLLGRHTSLPVLSTPNLPRVSSVDGGGAASKRTEREVRLPLADADAARRLASGRRGAEVARRWPCGELWRCCSRPCSSFRVERVSSKLDCPAVRFTRAFAFMRMTSARDGAPPSCDSLCRITFDR